MKTIDKRQLPATMTRNLGRKRSVFVSITLGPVSCTGTYWDGGSRGSWHELTIANGILSQPNYVNPENDVQLGLGHVNRSAQPRPGVAIVKLGTFCGKPATPHIYLHPDDATLLGL